MGSNDKGNLLKKISEAATAGQFDAAAGIRESVLNSFSEAHHSKEYIKKYNVYKGLVEWKEIGLLLTYDISKPSKFDLTPFANAAKDYKKWMLMQPEILEISRSQATRVLVDNPPATLQIKVPKISLTFKTANSEATLTYSFTVLAYVTISPNHLVQIVPIKSWADNSSQLEKDLKKLLGEKQDSECIALQSVIRDIINVQLAARIGSFVQSIPLPEPLELLGDVAVRDLNVQIIENCLLITGQVGNAHQLIQKRPISMVQTINPPNLINGKISKNKEVVSDIKLLPFVEFNTKTLPSNDLFIFLSQRLLQALADAYLKVEDSDGKCSRFLGFIEGCYDWFLKLWGPKVTIKNADLLIDAEFSGGAGVKARAHTHCGPTPWISVAVKAVSGDNDARKVRLTSKFIVDKNKIIISAGPRPFILKWEVEGLIWPIDEIIEIILGVLNLCATAFIEFIGKKWTVKVVEMPDKFPGTGMEYIGGIERITNINGDIALLGTLQFKK